MREIDSKDYHDFVIKDGKLIGEFDQMYRKSAQIPWHQDQEAFAVYSNILMGLAQAHAPYSDILDIGCGLGYFSNRIKKFGKVSGIDISADAISKARALFPEIEFEVLDVAGDSSPYFEKNRGRFDLIIMKEVLWYVLPRLDQALKNIDMMLRRSGYLIVSNFFPPLEGSFFGKDIIPNPSELQSYIEKRTGYKAVYNSVIKRFEFSDEGPLASVMLRKGK